jgi:hypothetical protein
MIPDAGEWVSTFCVDARKLTSVEIDKIFSYCKSMLNTEQWQVELTDKNNFLNGMCFGRDIGMFYLFLVGENLDERVEIIRA